MAVKCTPLMKNVLMGDGKRIPCHHLANHFPSPYDSFSINDYLIAIYGDPSFFNDVGIPVVVLLDRTIPLSTLTPHNTRAPLKSRVGLKCDMWGENPRLMRVNHHPGRLDIHLYFFRFSQT